MLLLPWSVPMGFPGACLLLYWDTQGQIKIMPINTWESRHCTLLGGTMEPIEVWVSPQLWAWKNNSVMRPHGWKRDVPSPMSFPLPTHPGLSNPKAGERVGLDIIRVGKLSQPLINCSTRESSPTLGECCLGNTVQLVGPEGWRYRCGRTNLEDMKVGEMAPPLDHHCKRWTSLSNTGELMLEAKSG